MKCEKCKQEIHPEPKPGQVWEEPQNCIWLIAHDGCAISLKDSSVLECASSYHKSNSWKLLAPTLEDYYREKFLEEYSGKWINHQGDPLPMDYNQNLNQAKEYAIQQDRERLAGEIQPIIEVLKTGKMAVAGSAFKFLNKCIEILTDIQDGIRKGKVEG